MNTNAMIWDNKKKAEHPLTSCDEYTKKFYIVILIAAALENKDFFEKSLDEIKALCNAVYYVHDEDMTQEIKLARTFSQATLNDCVETFRSSDIGRLLILDGLILAMETSKDNQPVINFILALAGAFEFDEKDTSFLINLAVVIVSKDLTKFNCSIVNQSDIYDYYLCDFDFSKFRKILYADKAIEKWIDEQPKIDDWMKKNNNFDTSVVGCMGMACKPNIGFSRPVDMIIKHGEKNIKIIGYFQLVDMWAPIDSATYINEFTSSHTYSDLNQYEQVVVLTRRISLSRIIQKGIIPVPEKINSIKGFDFLIPIFSKLPIGVFTHCLDNKKGFEDFFISCGGEIISDDDNQVENI